MQITQAIATEQARHIHHHMLQVSISNCLLAFGVATMFWRTETATLLVVWVMATAMHSACVLAVWRAFRHSTFAPASARRVFQLSILNASLSSIIWADGLFFFLPTGGFTQQLAFFLGTVLAGTMSVFSFGSYYPSFLAAFLPFAIATLYITGTREAATPMFFLGTATFIPTMLLYAWRFTRVLLESLQLRFENIDLVTQLTAQKEVAETAVLAKSRFLAAASHDLRQPTHALGLFIATLQSMAQRPDIKGADVGHIAGRLQTVLSGLAHLLNGLLDVSRLDAGAVEVRKQPVSLQSELTSLYNAFSGPANAKGLDFKVRLPASLSVDTDPMLLHQILSNLAANAVRYTECGRILIACRRRMGEVEIQVWDTGIGIAQDQLEKIFEEFYQVGNIARHQALGLGLGLAIVQRSARLLGTQLKVNSTLGKGSVFSFTLPRVVVTAALRQDEPAQLPSGRRRGATVLVIDDDPEVLEAVQILLSNWGHVVLAADTLEAAVEAVGGRIQKIDLILSDYRLADNVTGADAIRAVLACIGRSIPAAIITGDTSAERIREASASGFRLLHKPLDPQALNELLKEYDGL